MRKGSQVHHTVKSEMAQKFGAPGHVAGVHVSLRDALKAQLPNRHLPNLSCSNGKGVFRACSASPRVHLGLGEELGELAQQGGTLESPSSGGRLVSTSTQVEYCKLCFGS